MSFMRNRKLLRVFSLFIISMFLFYNLTPVTFSESSCSNDQSPPPQPLAGSQPEFENNSTPATGTTGDNLVFGINVTDSDGVHSVFVNYTWPSAGQSFNKTMTFIGGKTWENLSVMPTISTTITYYFIANDTLNNWNKTGPGFISIIDNDPPIIDNGSGNFTVGTGNSFAIHANFTDNVGLKNATIYYGKVSSGVDSDRMMTEGLEGQFSVTNIFLGIDTTSDISDYYFYVIGRDDMGYQVNYTYNEAMSMPWRFNVTDDDAPQYISSSENFTINISEGFIIEANFTDNMGIENVSNATIYYKAASAGVYDSMPMQKISFGNFSITNVTMGINTTDDDTDYLYNIWVNDTTGNNITYPIGYDFKITVKDNITPVSINGSGDITGLSSSGFNIYANFSDNINVSSARIFYAYESNVTYRNVTMIEGMLDGQFSVMNTTMDVDIYSDLTNLTYYVVAYDNDTNQARYNDTAGADWNITVIDDLPPTVINGSGDFKAFTGYPFNIYINFTDNVNVTRAVIYFKQQTGTSYCACNMTWSGIPGGFFIISDNLTQESGIDTTYTVTPLVYHILGYDPQNNVANYSKSQTLDWVITLEDNVRPTLVDCTQDFIVTTGEPFVIYANFTDNINVSHADIYFKRKSTTGSSTEYTAKSMQEMVGMDGHFYVTSAYLGMDTYWDDRDILFYYIPYDQMGNYYEQRKPSGIDYKITVIDNDKPWSISGTENITIYTGDNFAVFGNFSDNIVIDHVIFYYKKETWSVWESQEFSEEDDDSDSIWEFHISSTELIATIDTTNDDSDYFYYFLVYDGNKKNPNIYNYSYGTDGYRITVIDDDPPVSAKVKGSGSFTTTTGEPFMIYANFTDNVEVDFAQIYIRKYGVGARWTTPINMTESTQKPGIFYIINTDLTIDTTSSDIDYEYYVECFDTTGNYYIYDNNENTFKITVIDNDKPVANAGPNQEVEEGTIVNFNGNASADNIGIISYSWTFDYLQLEKTLTGVNPSFQFDEPGDYAVLLTIHDAQGNVDNDDVLINVSKKNNPPEIVAVKPEDGDTIYVFEVLPSEIFVRFSESILIDNIDFIDFFIMTDSLGNNVDGNFSWKEATLKLLFTPSSDLKYDETYTITVTTDVMDKTGKQLETGKTWSFSTWPADSDEDGLPDAWEIEYFGPDTGWGYWITQVGASDDPDNDDFTNLEEYLAGKNPDDKNDHPRVAEEGTEATFNFLLYIVLIIIIVVILVILIMGVMIYRKRKTEEEEQKGPTPIEHEILFDDGASAPGPVPEPAPVPSEKEPRGPEAAPYEEVAMEPALETPLPPEVEKPGEELEGVGEPELGELGLEEEEPEGEAPEPESGEPEDEEELDVDLPDEPEEEIQQLIDTGQELFDDGNYSDAVIEWQKALDIDPDQPEIQKLIKEAIEKMKE